MEQFIFALNATMPVFLVILLGWILYKIGLLNEAFCKVADQYVFKVALPVSLFQSVSTMDLYTDFDLRFCIFCALTTTVMFLGVWQIALRIIKDRKIVGAFSQAAVRSSAAILGLALASNIYGSVGMVPMMIVASVPLFNIYSVIILTFSPPADNQEKTNKINDTSAISLACMNVIRNPIIIGILLGIPFALLRIDLPVMLRSTITSIGGTATPIALLVVGASFSAGEALKKLKPAAVASIIKLIVLPAVFLPLAALIGFRHSSMVAILIMSGSPTTVSCYVMARQMHGDGILTSNAVILSTLGSSVTITLWLWILRLAELI